MVSANRKTLKKSTQFKTIAKEGVKNGFILGLCPNKGGSQNVHVCPYGGRGGLSLCPCGL